MTIICLQCVPILGRGFETGGYKCECRQGYEYPFEVIKIGPSSHPHFIRNIWAFVSEFIRFVIVDVIRSTVK